MTVLRILSFDPGTAETGWSLVEGTEKELRLTEHFGVVKTSKEDGDVRFRIDRIGHEMRRLIEELAPTHVVIEDFTEQGKRVGTTYKEMSWLIEHMRMVGREMDHVVTIYENAEWKQLAVGASRLNKDQVKHFVAHRVADAGVYLKGRPTHIWDSVGIGYAKYKQLTGGRTK